MPPHTEAADSPPESSAFRTESEGFSVIDAGGAATTYRDDDVLGFRVRTERTTNSAGDPNFHHRLEVRLQDLPSSSGDAGWIALDAEAGPFESNPLEPLRDRLTDRLADAAWHQLSAGRDVSTDEWRLSLLEFSDEQQAVTCDVAQLASATWEGNALCVWHEDCDQQPLARFDRANENTLVLDRLLRRLLHDPTPSIPEDLGLGKQIGTFQQFHRRRLATSVIAWPATLLLVGLLCTMTLFHFSLCILLMMVVWLTAAPFLRGRSEQLAFFERGVVWSNSHQQRLLMLDDLRAIQFIGSLDHDALDSNQGSEQEPKPQGAASPIRIVLSAFAPSLAPIAVDFQPNMGREQTDRLKSLQTHLAAHIANRMLVEWKETGWVEWTNNVWFTPTSLVSQQHGTRQEIAFNKVVVDRTNPDALRLTDNAGTVISMWRGAENYYPGLILARMIGTLDATAY